MNSTSKPSSLASTRAAMAGVMSASGEVSASGAYSSALGKTIRDAAHRPELYAPLAETSPDALITPAIAARVLAKEGGFDVLFINQADVLDDPAAVLQSFADTLPCPAIYGALAEGRWAKL